MAYTNQTTSSIADFISKLNTFLGANGWTTHHAPGSGEFAVEKNVSGALWVTMACQWDTGTPNRMGIYQWHGLTYNSGTSPWLQNLDSGSGAGSTTDATLAGERIVTLGSSGPSEFWCYEDTNYFHVIIRRDTAKYEHFGAGLMDTYNDWVGGEYTYGQLVEKTSGSSSAIQADASYLLDGLAKDSGAITNMEQYCATVHIDGMDEQTAGMIWGVVLGDQGSGNLGTDTAANARVHINGGYRAGLFPHLHGQFAGTIARGLVPMYPIVVSYWNRTNDDVYGPLGVMPDVRGVSIRNFTAAQEITVGGDTWVVFPSYQSSTSSAAGFTNYQGIAYKQVS